MDLANLAVHQGLHLLILAVLPVDRNVIKNVFTCVADRSSGLVVTDCRIAARPTWQLHQYLLDIAEELVFEGFSQPLY